MENLRAQCRKFALTSSCNVFRRYAPPSNGSFGATTPVQELQSVNPLKQIPTLLLPDNSILTESAAILIWLGMEFSSYRIFPDRAESKAKVIQGLVYIATNCYTVVGIIDFPERWTSKNDEKELENIRIGTRQRLNQHWDFFVDMFHPKPYLSGDQPGVLDFMTATVCRMLGAKKHLQSSRPEFFDFLCELEKHPIIAPVVSRHWD